MHKYIIALLFAVICSIFCLQPARAQGAPVLYAHSHTLNAVYSEWTVPYRQNGALLSLQALGITNSATVAIKHITTYATGLALTKLDGTAKGGVIFALAKQFNIPIRFIGVGEGIDDLRTFEAEPFVKALFAERD
jgi:hypothetical protein